MLCCWDPYACWLHRDMVSEFIVGTSDLADLAFAPDGTM
eukprot:SAG31_NODE_32434_length_356_cov_0.599222_2_plen_38_part_01